MSSLVEEEVLVSTCMNPKFKGTSVLELTFSRTLFVLVFYLFCGSTFSLVEQEVLVCTRMNPECKAISARDYS